VIAAGGLAGDVGAIGTVGTMASLTGRAITLVGKEGMALTQLRAIKSGQSTSSIVSAATLSRQRKA
jgi:hypothetical protein